MLYTRKGKGRENTTSRSTHVYYIAKRGRRQRPNENPGETKPELRNVMRTQTKTPTLN